MRTNIIGASYDSFTFPGGEPHVKILQEGHVCIDARIRSFNDLGEVLVMTDALKRMGCKEVYLNLPYFPGARQDRAQDGEALTVKVYADIINAQGYVQVAILDPHSPVVVALIDRVQVISPLSAIRKFAEENKITHLICPDAGAEKRVWEVGQALKLPVIHARKHRDPSTGKLSEFSVEWQPQKDAQCLVVDDICDGGGTFLGIAEAMQKGYVNHWPVLFLWVTHGIFSKGINDLIRVYERIGTTNSFYEGDSLYVNVYRVEDL